MHGNSQVFLESISGFLGWYYVVLAAMNMVAAYWLWRSRRAVGQAIFWLLVGLFYMGYLGPMALSGDPAWMPQMPAFIRNLVNVSLGGSTGAVIYSVGSLVVLVVLYLGRRFFVRGPVAWGMLNLSLLALGLSMTDYNFYTIAAKPDNVPIVGLIFLIAFFTWLATSRAVENDDRIARGEPTLEHEGSEKILVWPDLVYTELICMVALTAFLLLWGIGLQAPLEEPASSVKTPNPSKAPWYFLGLQEMLVYFDPWMAGVVMPSMIVVGLMAIPYLDFNPKGMGYYTIAERKFSYLTYQVGFLLLWIVLIVLGTFLRGPNWNIYSPYELWDVHKVEALNNVDLSQYFWISGMNMALPRAPTGSSVPVQIFYILQREWLGIALVLGYFVLLPPVMAITVFRKYYKKMGFVRFMLMSNLLLFMLLLPIKMVLRWTVNLKYIVAIPEYFLNL
ncbi:MAG: hypothetical protein VX970_07730 [Planctomycetota bacterium]|nr:hypothetical protein [Planctomycetota bacterium]MEC8338319.1 hypothetical protein [Planctomycetota bacterium]